MFHTVKSGDTLYSISRQYNLTPKEITALNNLSSNSTINIGQELRVSEHTSPAATKANANAMYHEVQAGESLFAIARRYQITVDDVKQLNGLKENATIYVGQRLRVTKVPTIPPQDPNTGFYTVKAGDTISRIAAYFGFTPMELLKLNGLDQNATIHIDQQLRIKKDAPVVPPNEQKQEKEEKAVNTPRTIPDTYTVVKGDNFLKISKKFGISPQVLLAINKLNGNSTIYPGMVLYLKESAKPQPIQEKVFKEVQQPISNNIPSYLKGQAEAFNKARSIFQLTEEGGKAFFGSGLKAAVGRVYNNHPDDLTKVQKRLMQLKFLDKNHKESPIYLKDVMVNGMISSSSIPATIRAIEDFQRKFRLDYWTQREKHINMLGTKELKKGIVGTNDVTYMVLRNYAEYTLTVPDPIQKGAKIKCEFKNFVRSSYNEFYDGVSFVGNSNPDIPYETYQMLGLSRNLAKAVKYVSMHEGNFDAINSYDKAFFSWGFIQFAGNGGGLSPVIANIKRREPQLFKYFFQQFGIDVSYTERGGYVKDAELIVFDTKGTNKGKVEVKGIEAEKAIRADKQLYGPFILAGYHPKTIIAQIEHAVQGYVKPALSIKISISTHRFNLTDVPLTDYIRSPMGLAMMIDLTVNQWINKTRDIFKAAIERVAAEDKLISEPLLRSIDERKVLKNIVAYAGADKRIKTRGEHILHSSLSSEKQDGNLI